MHAQQAGSPFFQAQNNIKETLPASEVCDIIFMYEVFTGRILLATLDHNFHVFRKTLEGQFKKIYSKRCGN